MLLEVILRSLAGAVLGELGRHFERVDRKFHFVKLSSFLIFIIFDMMMIPCGRCSTSDGRRRTFLTFISPGERNDL